MKTKLIYLIIMMAFLTSCNTKNKQEKQVASKPNYNLTGEWIRFGQMGQISFNFKENGLVEGDFGNDETVDVVAKYELIGDTIQFTDIEGKMCQNIGQYLITQTEYYLSFDLIDDDCGGRIKTTMGFWTKPNFRELLKTLENEIAKSPKPKLYLNRARVFMAVAMAQEAKKDFDEYLLTDTLNSRVYINRAGTRFPNDLFGVVSDCNKSISLEPDNKNAYFLRGLALYELGKKEEGCEDFSKAIELGFSVLKIAEQEKCVDYWDK